MRSRETQEATTLDPLGSAESCNDGAEDSGFFFKGKHMGRHGKNHSEFRVFLIELQMYWKILEAQSAVDQISLCSNQASSL